MNSHIYLVTGGARSGKSTFAQQLAQSLGRKIVYIATAEPGDPEMNDRIVKHRASRPASWETVESPIDIANVISTHGQKADVLLIDCLTLFISNLIFREIGTVGENENPSYDPKIEDMIVTEVIKVLETAQTVSAAVIFVTNEVGTGLVPPYQLGRLYRDAVGRANQQIAALAKQVFLLACGIPIDLKSCAFSLPAFNETDESVLKTTDSLPT